MYRIPDCNLSELVARIEKLGRRAEKLGLTAPTVEVVGHEDIPVWRFRFGAQPFKCGRDWRFVREGEIETRDDLTEFAGLVYHNRYHFVELHGEAPTVPGWALVAVVEHCPELGGNVLRGVPGRDCPVAYRSAEPLCEHCGTLRRRNETFVLVDAQGSYKQVGRNCLADFCRSPEAAEHMAKTAELLASAGAFCSSAEDEDGFGRGGRGAQFHQLADVLALTHAFTRHLGWVPRSAGFGATANLVLECLTRRDWEKDADPKQVAAYEDCGDRDTATAEAALAWIRAKRNESEQLNDYLYNLLVISSLDMVKPEHFGLACSLIGAYLRDAEQVEKQKRVSNSQHFGTIKKREVFTLTLLGMNCFEGGEWGPRHLYRFADSAGNVAVWWSGKDVEVKIGQTYQVKATVKAHGEYKGVKQTELTRCAVA